MTSPHPLMTPAQEAINGRIRRLMSQPRHHRRGEEYARLLVLWAEASEAPHRGSDRGAPRPHPQTAAVYMDIGHDTTAVGLSA